MGNDEIKLSLPDVKTYCSTPRIKAAAWVRELSDRPVKPNRNSRTRPKCIKKCSI